MASESACSPRARRIFYAPTTYFPLLTPACHMAPPLSMLTLSLLRRPPTSSTIRAFDECSPSALQSSACMGREDGRLTYHVVDTRARRLRLQDFRGPLDVPYLSIGASNTRRGRGLGPKERLCAPWIMSVQRGCRYPCNAGATRCLCDCAAAFDGALFRTGKWWYRTTRCRC